MSRRIHPIIKNQIYHVYNKGIAGQPIFFSSYDYQRFLNLIDYYRFVSPDLRFSFYNRLSIKEKQKYLNDMKSIKPKGVAIYAYCLMPNHYHFLLKELEVNGLRKFISNLQNGYAKYLNKKRKRSGSLFHEMFKLVRVEDDEQFIHVARYIHLNPLTSYVIREEKELENYFWSSFASYLNTTNCDFLDSDFLLGFYPNKEKLRIFTLDQADYQKKIHNLEYLNIEKDY